MELDFVNILEIGFYFNYFKLLWKRSKRQIIAFILVKPSSEPHKVHFIVC